METRTQAITAQQARDDSLRGATASPITPKPQTPKSFRMKDIKKRIIIIHYNKTKINIERNNNVVSFCLKQNLPLRRHSLPSIRAY
jgi:hypothetical protein